MTTTTGTNALLGAYLSSSPEVQRSLLLWQYQHGHGYAFNLTHLTNAPDLGRCLTPRTWATIPAFRQQLLGWLDQLIEHRPRPGLRAVGGSATRTVGPFTVTPPSFDPDHVTAGMDALKGGFLRIDRPEVVRRVRNRFSRHKTELTKWTRLEVEPLAAALSEERRRETEFDDLQRLRIRLTAWFDALETAKPN